MAEQINPPVPTGPVTTLWQVKSLYMRRGYNSDGGGVSLNTEQSFIQVELIGENGKIFQHTWKGPAADADIVSLNKANLTSNSLQRRVLTKLNADGIITGTISGGPD